MNTWILKGLILSFIQKVKNYLFLRNFTSDPVPPVFTEAGCSPGQLLDSEDSIYVFVFPTKKKLFYFSTIMSQVS